MRYSAEIITHLRKEIEPVLSRIRDQLHDLRVDTSDSELDVHFVSQPDDRAPGRLLRVLVHEEQKIIDIPNIFKPQNISERGVGRSLIASALVVADRFGYRLLITDLVPGFFRKLVSWGGVHVADSIVEITAATRLTDVIPGYSTFDEHDATYLTQEQRETGYQRFLGDHPDIASEIEEFEPWLAEALGIDLQKRRTDLIEKAIDENARASGLDRFEYFLGYAVASVSEREHILQARRDFIVAALGRKNSA